MRNNLADLIGDSLVMKTKYGEIEGTIKYGIRPPISSGTTPLVECDLNSKKEIDGEVPTYYFVNGNQSVKVRLLFNLPVTKENTVKGIGKDSRFFLYTIKPKPKIN